MLALAFDYAPSVRNYDSDGRLHVATANISKSCVNDYSGSEIPGAAALGLDPQRTYSLLRDPDELEKATKTFNSIPLLSRHVPVDAVNYEPSLVVGATGSDATFEFPYLRNSLVIWARPAIDAIEDGTQRELSAAYRYVPVMQSGTFEGERYDGRMTRIQANHLALCDRGRAGPDVVIGDAALFCMSRGAAKRAAWDFSFDKSWRR